MSHGGYITADPIRFIIICVKDTPDYIQVKAGVCFSSLIVGCGCADDSTPMETVAEYGVLQYNIDKITATTPVEVLEDSRV